ncbi:MAG TPA: hypothetical protein VEX18_22610 [Polyangiaceae bacterium]|nr:hypothetical protein [Polyangiaceae bacterium]
MEDETQETEEASAGPSINAEVLKSYLAFARRALLARKWLIASIMVVVVTATVVVARYFPRTYSVSTVMMTVQNAVLDSQRVMPLVGAEGLIMSHKTLEKLIEATDLRKKYHPRRPPLLAMKDKLLASAFGPMDDKTLTAVLVGTLEGRIIVETKDDNLTITVNWSDPKTAAELAQATQDEFVRIRHRAEISAFQEKMAILDMHAGKLRQEIDVLAEQMKAALAAKAAETAAELKAGNATASKTAAAVAARPRLGGNVKPIADEQIPGIRERLLALKQKLSTAEDARSDKMQAEQAKLDELKVRFTPSHPQVITQQERLGLASQVSSELALLRAEVGDLESQLRQRESMVKTNSRLPSLAGGVGSSTLEPTAAPLPSEIMSLLEDHEADPALAAQISGAIVRYGSLRDDVRGAKQALDMAQAAFNHRYQVVIPVEVPNRPSKPKVPLIVGGGLALALLLALAVPILLELRRGVVVERWQMEHFQLPVLAELRLPGKPQD